MLQILEADLWQYQTVNHLLPSWYNFYVLAAPKAKSSHELDPLPEQQITSPNRWHSDSFSLSLNCIKSSSAAERSRAMACELSSNTEEDYQLRDASAAASKP